MRGAIGSVVEGDLDFSVEFADGVGADPSDGGAAEDLAGGKAKFGVVPGAGDASVFDGAKGDGGVGVGAEVVEGVDRVIMPDEGDAMAFELVGASFAVFKLGGGGDSLVVHGGGRFAP